MQEISVAELGDLLQNNTLTGKVTFKADISVLLVEDEENNEKETKEKVTFESRNRTVSLTKRVNWYTLSGKVEKFGGLVPYNLRMMPRRKITVCVAYLGFTKREDAYIIIPFYTVLGKGGAVGNQRKKLRIDNPQEIFYDP